LYVFGSVMMKLTGKIVLHAASPQKIHDISFESVMGNPEDTTLTALTTCHQPSVLLYSSFFFAGSVSTVIGQATWRTSHCER